MKKIRVRSLIKNDHSSYYTAFSDISQSCKERDGDKHVAPGPYGPLQ